MDILKSKKGVAVYLCVVLIIAAAFICVFIPKNDGDQSKEKPFGNIFGTDSSGPSESIDYGEVSAITESRPDKNEGIPYDKTLLSHALDNVDKYHLYISGSTNTLSSTGYVTTLIEYAISGSKIYICMRTGDTVLQFLSDGERLLGLDFDEQTYVVLSPHAYTPDELLYLGDYEFCTSTGKDVFMGEELTYEDFTIENVGADISWIRYYFRDDGFLAGYAKYVSGELTELTAYTTFTSEYPDDAVLYFSIPTGFKQYDNIVEWSDIFVEY